MHQDAPGGRGWLPRRAAPGTHALSATARPRIRFGTARVTGARRLHREPKVRAEQGIQPCEIVGIDGTTAAITTVPHAPIQCHPTRAPVRWGYPSHCLAVRFHGVRRQGLGAWPGAPNVVTTTPRRLLRTNRRRPPVPSPRLIRSCEIVSEQPACHRERPDRGVDPRPRKSASRRHLESSAPPTATGPRREGEAPL